MDIWFPSVGNKVALKNDKLYMHYWYAVAIDSKVDGHDVTRKPLQA